MTAPNLDTDAAERRALMQRIRRSGTAAEEQIAALCRKLRLAYRPERPLSAGFPRSR
jgi:G:T-mismatch repair DNA endonuclease (very short patch repair protein)